MRPTDGIFKRKIWLCALAALLAAALLAGCASGKTGGETERETTAETGGNETLGVEISALAAHLTNGGWSVKYYEEGDEMLAALDDEMDRYIDYPPDEPLAGYLFANNAETGDLDCEVFLFRSAKDAAVLYEYLKDGEQFVEGVSAIRRSGELVYMGYVEALDFIEKGIG